jgi:hypothetical protein
MATARLPDPQPPQLRRPAFDPDRNEVELQVDNFKTRESMDAWFRTGAFDRNFVGIPFDPEDMVRLHREGVPEDAILQKELYR